MPTISNEKLGKSYDLPEFRQGEVEDFYATLREIQAGLSGVTDAMAGSALLEFVTGLAKSGAKLTAEQYRTVVGEFMSNLRIVGERRGQLSSPEYTGVVVRVASRLGWIDTAEDDVETMRPAVVNWLNTEIQRLLKEAYEVDPS